MVPGQCRAELPQRLPRIGDHGDPAAVLVRVERSDVDVDEAHLRMLEQRAAGRGEIAVAGADADHQVRLSGQPVRRRPTGGSHTAECLGVVPVQRPTAGVRGADGNAGGVAELAQCVVRVGVDDATAGDDDRPLRPSDRVGGRLDRPGLGGRAPDVPVARGEELLGHLERLRLDILRQRDRDGAGLDRIGEHPHRRQCDGRQLLRAIHPIEEPRHRPEGIRDLHGRVVRQLDLLQYRVGHAGGERVAGQQQRRQPVGGGERRAGDHVGRAGPDRAGAGQGGPAAVHARVSDRLVHHRLLVARLVERHQVRVGGIGLHHGLAQPRHVAVPEDAQQLRDGAFAMLPVDRVLVGQERDQRLPHRHSSRCHRRSSPVPKGSRRSGSSPSQSSRTQECAGSSVMFHTRSGSGPAITLR